MKNTYRFGRATLVLSLLALAGLANAQSSATVYGIVDAGLRSGDGLDSAYAASAGSATVVNSGINTTSRLGYRGAEDLGAGLQAIFNFESGLNVDAGAPVNAAKFFDRASVVGLKGEWGTLTVGRQTTLLADINGQVDPLSSRFASFNPNIAIASISAHRLGAEYGPSGASTGSFRLDNSIKYVTQFGGFSARFMHALGEQTGNDSNLSSTGVGVGYQKDVFTGTLAYQQFKGATGLNLNAYFGGVSAMLGKGRIALTYANHEAETTLTSKTTNTTLGAGGTIPLKENLDVIVTYYQVNRSRTASVDDGFSRVISFLEYKLSNRTLVYVEADQTSWRDGYQAVGMKKDASGVSLGLLHRF